MTGYDACMFVSRLYAVDARRNLVRAGLLELGHYFYEPVNSYSSGMRAKLNFGLSMSIDFDCLSHRRNHRRRRQPLQGQVPGSVCRAPQAV